MRILGKDLKIGDVVSVWWQPAGSQVIKMRPYTGPLECIKGASIAAFPYYSTYKGEIVDFEMTIVPGMDFNLLERDGLVVGTSCILN